MLTAFYDLKFGPVSFDFVTWLVRAKKEAGDSPLHVVIVPHETGLGGFARHWGTHDEHATRWRLWHIVVASCPLAQATVTVAGSRKQAEQLKVEPFWWQEGKAHFIGPLVDASRKGEKIPKLKATEAARRYIKSACSDFGDRFVTLTTRNQSTDPARNSNRAEWHKLADYLNPKWEVIWLDDTHQALKHGSGHFAQLDPDLRLALYEKSYMNFIGANGPDVLLKFSDSPYLNFCQAQKGWEDHYKKYLSLDIGDQLPWAGKNQSLVYKPDTFENMRDAWARATN